MAVLRPDMMMKCVIPVVMAGIIAIVSVLNRNTSAHSPSRSPAPTRTRFARARGR